MCRSLLFSRKNNPTNTEGQSDIPGWKLFGKVPPKLAPEKDASDISLQFKHTRRLDSGRPEHESSTVSEGGHVARRSEKEVPSTTALILEHRPELVLCFVII